ncbi:MAG: sigma-54-dependent transcriptional regulator [uncultured Paraburkholderia sp.]|nr:MAG: sigma-54-dependent transcriptional regulator [uncultured Paraburkholderia sp.]
MGTCLARARLHCRVPARAFLSALYVAHLLRRADFRRQRRDRRLLDVTSRSKLLQQHSLVLVGMSRQMI